MPNSLIWSLCFDFSQYQHETTYSDLVWRLAFLILAFKLLFLHCMKLLTLLFRVCIVHVRFTVMSISINCKINDIYFTVTYKIITYVDTSYEKQYHWPPVVNVPVLKVFIGAVSWAFLLSYILYHLITLKSISGHYYQNNKHEVLVLISNEHPILSNSQWAGLLPLSQTFFDIQNIDNNIACWILGRIEPGALIFLWWNFDLIRFRSWGGGRHIFHNSKHIYICMFPNKSFVLGIWHC